MWVTMASLASRLNIPSGKGSDPLGGRSLLRASASLPSFYLSLPFTPVIPSTHATWHLLYGQGAGDDDGRLVS